MKKNPWFVNYWEMKFNCDPTEEHENRSNACNGDEHLTIGHGEFLNDKKNEKNTIQLTIQLFTLYSEI